MRRRMIEELRNSMAHLVESCPIEIAKYDPLFCFLLRSFDEMHLRAKILPRLAIEDQPIHPRPKLRVHRVGKIVLPPKVKWQVGIEVGKDNAREEFYARAFQRKRKLLGTNLFAPGAGYVTVRVQPGFDPVLFRFSIRSDHERAAGMILGDPGDQLRIPLKRTGLFAVKGEINKRRAGHRVFAFLPEFFQLLVDLADLDRLA